MRAGNNSKSFVHHPPKTISPLLLKGRKGKGRMARFFLTIHGEDISRMSMWIRQWRNLLASLKFTIPFLILIILFVASDSKVSKEVFKVSDDGSIEDIEDEDDTQEDDQEGLEAETMNTSLRWVLIISALSQPSVINPNFERMICLHSQETRKKTPNKIVDEDLFMPFRSCTTAFLCYAMQ